MEQLPRSLQRLSVKIETAKKAFLKKKHNWLHEKIGDMQFSTEAEQAWNAAIITGGLSCVFM